MRFTIIIQLLLIIFFNGFTQPTIAQKDKLPEVSQTLMKVINSEISKRDSIIQVLEKKLRNARIHFAAVTEKSDSVVALLDSMVTSLENYKNKFIAYKNMTDAQVIILQKNLANEQQKLLTLDSLYKKKISMIKTRVQQALARSIIPSFQIDFVYGNGVGIMKSTDRDSNCEYFYVRNVRNNQLRLSYSFTGIKHVTSYYDEEIDKIANTLVLNGISDSIVPIGSYKVEIEIEEAGRVISRYETSSQEEIKVYKNGTYDANNVESTVPNRELCNNLEQRTEFVPDEEALYIIKVTITDNNTRTVITSLTQEFRFTRKKPKRK